jgi:hypothetical protein
MNEITKREHEGAVNGVPGRFFTVVQDTTAGRVLNQTWKSEARAYKAGGECYRLRVEMRFDDGCHNGHESFAITATEHRLERGSWRESAGGCLHVTIAERFPELAPLIRWHLCSTDGPMHYEANTVYLAGDRDYNGLRKGETRQIRNGKTGMLAWRLALVDGAGEVIDAPERYVDSDVQPAFSARTCYVPWLRVGEGKERELDAARRVAIWPDATDETLCLPPEELRAALRARLPRLLQDFERDMRAAGFVWPSAGA